MVDNQRTSGSGIARDKDQGSRVPYSREQRSRMENNARRIWRTTRNSKRKVLVLQFLTRTSGGAGGEDANDAAGEEKNSAKPSRGKIH